MQPDSDTETQATTTTALARPIEDIMLPKEIEEAAAVLVPKEKFEAHRKVSLYFDQVRKRRDKIHDDVNHQEDDLDELCKKLVGHRSCNCSFKGDVITANNEEWKRGEASPELLARMQKLHKAREKHISSKRKSPKTTKMFDKEDKTISALINEEIKKTVPDSIIETVQYCYDGKWSVQRKWTATANLNEYPEYLDIKAILLKLKHEDVLLKKEEDKLRDLLWQSNSNGCDRGGWGWNVISWGR